MSKGRIRVSLDFECGWGVAQGGGWRSVEAAGIYRALRPALRRFTRQLDTLELSFSWAVVGGMVDDPVRRDVSHLRGGIARDMKTFLTEAEEPTVDGRDLLDMVAGMRTGQFFGTHTYTHLLFSDPEQDSDVIAQDLALAIKTNAGLGLEATRLVFPRNHAGHLETVAAAGITHARMPPFNAPDPTARRGLARRALSAVLRPISPVKERPGPRGLVLHHATEFLNWGISAGAAKRRVQRWRISRGIELACRGSDVHFWLHPFNLVESPGFELAMNDFVVRIAVLRDRDLIEVGGF